MSTPNFGKNVGKYLKYQREKRNKTINDFAKKLDITPTFLMRLEKGEYRSIKISFLYKIAMGLRMTLKELLIRAEIIEGTRELPALKVYLREKYQFPKKAVDDAEMYVDFLKIRYKTDINKLTTLHNKYWKGKDI